MYVLICLCGLVKTYAQWQIIALQMIYNDMVQSGISSYCDALGKLFFFWQTLEEIGIFFCSTNVSIFLEFPK